MQALTIRHPFIRFSLGVPLEDIFPEGDLHPSIRRLLVEAFNAIQVSRLPIKYILRYDAPYPECLSLEESLVRCEQIDLMHPGTLLWMLRHFLGLLPLPLLPKYTDGETFAWTKISDRCRYALERYARDRRTNECIIDVLTDELLRLPPVNLLLIGYLINFLRSLIVRPGKHSKFNKNSTLALANYFAPAIFARPYYNKHKTKTEQLYRPLMLYFLIKWPDIQMRCVEKHPCCFVPLERRLPFPRFTIRTLPTQKRTSCTQTEILQFSLKDRQLNFIQEENDHELLNAVNYDGNKNVKLHDLESVANEKQLVEKWVVEAGRKADDDSPSIKQGYFGSQIMDEFQTDVCKLKHDSLKIERGKIIDETNKGRLIKETIDETKSGLLMTEIIDETKRSGLIKGTINESKSGHLIKEIDGTKKETIDETESGYVMKEIIDRTKRGSLIKDTIAEDKSGGSISNRTNFSESKSNHLISKTRKFIDDLKSASFISSKIFRSKTSIDGSKRDKSSSSTSDSIVSDKLFSEANMLKTSTQNRLKTLTSEKVYNASVGTLSGKVCEANNLQTTTQKRLSSDRILNTLPGKLFNEANSTQKRLTSSGKLYTEANILTSDCRTKYCMDSISEEVSTSSDSYVSLTETDFLKDTACQTDFPKTSSFTQTRSVEDYPFTFWNQELLDGCSKCQRCRRSEKIAYAPPSEKRFDHPEVDRISVCAKEKQQTKSLPHFACTKVDYRTKTHGNDYVRNNRCAQVEYPKKEFQLKSVEDIAKLLERPKIETKEVAKIEVNRYPIANLESNDAFENSDESNNAEVAQPKEPFSHPKKECECTKNFGLTKNVAQYKAVDYSEVPQYEVVDYSEVPQYEEVAQHKVVVDYSEDAYENTRPQTDEIGCLNIGFDEPEETIYLSPNKSEVSSSCGTKEDLIVRSSQIGWTYTRETPSLHMIRSRPTSSTKRHSLIHYSNSDDFVKQMPDLINQASFVKVTPEVDFEEGVNVTNKEFSEFNSMETPLHPARSRWSLSRFKSRLDFLKVFKERRVFSDEHIRSKIKYEKMDCHKSTTF